MIHKLLRNCSSPVADPVGSWSNFRWVRGLLPALLIVFSSSLFLRAETLIYWDLDGVPNSPVPTVEPSIMADGLESSGLLRGPGVEAGGLTNGFSAAGYTTGNPNRATALANGEYIGFDLTVVPGNFASLASLDISLRRSAFNGPMFMELQYSFDGFATPGTTIVDFTYRGRASGADNPQSTNPEDYMVFGAPDSYLDEFDLPPDLSGQSSSVSDPGNPIPTIDLSGIEELQDLPGGTTVTFGLFAWGNDSTTNTNTVGFGRMVGPRVQGTVMEDPDAVDQILVEVISEIPGTMPEPGLHLYASGSEVTLTAPENVEHNGSEFLSVGWSGTGSAPAQGTGNSVTFTITEPTTVTWHWLRNAGPLGPILFYDVVASTGPTLEAATDLIGVSPLVLSLGPGVNPTGLANGFSANGWDGKTSRDISLSTGAYFEMGLTVEEGYSASFSTIEASLRRTAINAPMFFEWQYSLDGFATGGVTIPPTGPFWSEIGWEETFFNYFGRTSGTAPADPVPLYAWVTEDVPGHGNTTLSPGDPIPPIDLTSIGALQDVPAGTTVTFRLYAWGNAATTPTNTVAFGRMDGPVIKGVVAPQGQTPLTIESTQEGTDPESGFRIHPVGTLISATAPESIPVSEGTRSQLTGWSATGSAPASGTTNSTSFTLNQATTLTWNWDLQHRLQLATLGEGSVTAISSLGTTPVTGSDAIWVSADDTLTLETSPAANHVFAGWSGEFVNSAPVFSLPMSRPLTLNARFAADSDGDGIPDDWKLQFFGDLSAGALEDPDGDGFNNLEEYRRGTNPTFAEELVSFDNMVISPWENTQRDPLLPGGMVVRDFGMGFRGVWEGTNHNRSALLPFAPDGSEITPVPNVSFDGPRMILRDEAWDPAWSDSTVETVFSVGDDDGTALYFRYQDEMNWYRVVVSGEVNTAQNRPLFGVSVQKRVDGEYTSLGLSGAIGTDPQDIEWYKRVRVSVEQNGSSFVVRVTGWDVFLATPDFDPNSTVELFIFDTDLPEGRAGIGTWAQGGAPGGTIHPDWNPVDNGTLFESFRVVKDGVTVFEDDWSDAPLAEELPEGWENAFDGVSGLSGNWRNSAHGSIAQIASHGGATSSTATESTADADGPVLLAPETGLTNYVVDLGIHQFNHGAAGLVFDYQDSENYGRVLLVNTTGAVAGSIPDGVVVSRKVNGVWNDLFIGDVSHVPTLARPASLSLSRSGSNYVMTVMDEGGDLVRWDWNDPSAPSGAGRHGLTTWLAPHTHFNFLEVYAAEAVADEGLAITGIERVGEMINISVDNPSGLPYRVQRSFDLADWQDVATGQTLPVWAGEIPAGQDRVFWRIVR